MVVRCQCLSSRTVVQGTQQPPPQVSVSADVPACHCDRPEWVQVHHLPGPEGAIAQARSRGGTNCHGACWSQLYAPGHWGMYWDVYQLYRLPGRGQCEEAIEEQLCKEVLDSINDCLWLKWPPTQPEREWTQLSANAPQPDPHRTLTAMNLSTYEKFAATNQETYEEMVALTRDAHQWTLVATVILEEQMERMSHSTSCLCSTSHQCSPSCHCSSSCRRSRSFRQQEEGSQVIQAMGNPRPD